MIVYKLGSDGSFVAGETETGFTCYAYPSSHHATQAKYRSLEAATEMMLNEIPHHYSNGHAAEYDRRNWEILNK